jgi:hypothetical protein
MKLKLGVGGGETAHVGWANGLSARELRLRYRFSQNCLRSYRLRIQICYATPQDDQSMEQETHRNFV